MQKKIVSAVLILTVLLGVMFSFSSCGEKEGGLQTYNFKADLLRVGIMSDNQLQQEGSSEAYAEYLRKGL